MIAPHHIPVTLHGQGGSRTAPPAIVARLNIPALALAMDALEIADRGDCFEKINIIFNAWRASLNL